MGWGRFYQAQGIHELAPEHGQKEFYAAELAEHVIAEVDQQVTSNFSWRLDFYRKNYDQLAPRWENQPFSLVGLLPEADIFVNASKAISRGVELSVYHTIDESLSWFLNYSYSKTRQQVAGKLQPRPWDQNHTANFGLSYAWRRWQFSGGASYHSGRPFRSVYLEEYPGDNNQPEELPVLSKYQDDRLHGASEFEVAIARNWKLTDASELELGFKAQNAENFKTRILTVELAF